jgi:hypothetical protein
MGSRLKFQELAGNQKVSTLQEPSIPASHVPALEEASVDGAVVAEVAGAGAALAASASRR